MEREEKVDVDALMDEIRKRVEERRRKGEYREVDDPRPFAELAAEDDLAASANRLAAIAQVPGVAPELLPRPPGVGRRGESRKLDDSSPAANGVEAAKESRSPAELAATATSPPPAVGVAERALGAARRVVARVAGERVEAFVRSVSDYFLESAANARLVAERLIALERRVAELEAAKERSASSTRRRGGTSVGSSRRHSPTKPRAKKGSAQSAKSGAKKGSAQSAKSGAKKGSAQSAKSRAAKGSTASG